MAGLRVALFFVRVAPLARGLLVAAGAGDGVAPADRASSWDAEWFAERDDMQQSFQLRIERDRRALMRNTVHRAGGQGKPAAPGRNHNDGGTQGGE